MKDLLKNRFVVALLAAGAAMGINALRDAGIPVECPPVVAVPAVLIDAGAP